MAGVLYLTNDPKFGVVAPINTEKERAKRRQYKIMGLLIIVIKNLNGPARKKTKIVNRSMNKLSSEAANTVAFFASQTKGLYKVANIAAGAILIKLETVPSNSTPSEKLEPAFSSRFEYDS